MQKVVYLSGRITDNEHYKDDFARAEKFLVDLGYIVINPAFFGDVIEGLTYEQILQICYRCIDVSTAIFMMSGWQKSRGATAELSYAKSLGKKVMYQDYYRPFRKETRDVES